MEHLNWNPIVAQVGAWLAALGVTGATAGAAAYGLFRWFGGKWLEGKFAKDLEDFKSEKNKELEKLKSDYQQETERLKAEISRLMDRAAKLHAQEYVVLPKAWGLLNQAFGAVTDVVSSFQEHADLNKMKPAQFEEFLKGSELPDWQKDELRKASDKSLEYGQMRVRIQLNRAQLACFKYQNYIILKGVFIEDEMAQKMGEASMKLRIALNFRKLIAQGIGVHEEWDKAQKLLQEAESLVADIKADIRTRMFDTRLPEA